MTTIGILGAGQLGKMLAEAASNLGFKTHIFAPDADPIAAQLATHFTSADYNDLAALQQFAKQVDIITLEFENVPVEPLKTLFTPIYPSVSVLEISQHRIREKMLARELAIRTAPFAEVNSQEDVEHAIKTIGAPGILKTCTLGYDGKGQWKLDDGWQKTDEGNQYPWSSVLRPPSSDFIYEGFVNFKKEISVIVARSTSGEVQCFEPVENIHKNHILHTTMAPANISDKVAAKAIEIAIKLATVLEVVGLLAVELFVTREGEVLMNEIAPRPHNSGHWTMDGCNISQFEQAIRAVSGMPLIKPQRIAGKVMMTNIIGDDVNDLSQWEKPGAHIHLYGKKETRTGRKMGHVTVVE